jgi:hypothetical protein
LLLLVAWVAVSQEMLEEDMDGMVSVRQVLSQGSRTMFFLEIYAVCLLFLLLLMIGYDLLGSVRVHTSTVTNVKFHSISCMFNILLL